MLWFGQHFTGNVAVATDWDSTEVGILAGTATLGVVVQALALFGFLGRASIRFRPDFRFRGVGLGATTKLAAWTFGMIVVTQIAGIVQSNIASLADRIRRAGPRRSSVWLARLHASAFGYYRVARNRVLHADEHRCSG